MTLEDEILDKEDIIKVVLRENAQFIGPNFFDDIILIQNSLTTISPEEVDLSVNFLGHKLSNPLIIGSLVGGSEKQAQINQKIAEFASKFNLAMGIGDQIFGIKEPALASTYSIIRESNPEGLILGNISAIDLLQSQDPFLLINQAIDMIKADMLEIYVNPIQDYLNHPESISYKGYLSLLERICSTQKIPIIAKNAGTGFSVEDVRQLWDLGVSAINTQGMGGTSLARIETLRNLNLAEKQSDRVGPRPFDFWGLPTPWSLLDLTLRAEHCPIPLIVGGGIRTGVEAIKALALGADLITIAYPILVQIIEDFGYPKDQHLEHWYRNFHHEMIMTMALLGARNIQELRETARNRILILGKTREFIKERNLIFPPRKLRNCLI